MLTITEFHWADVYRRPSLFGMDGNTSSVKITTPETTLLYLLLNAGVFIVIAWYLDNVVRGNAL